MKLPEGAKTHEELLFAELAADPEFAIEWERLALARMVAARLCGYRSSAERARLHLASTIQEGA
jgi:hypothetical protein